MPIGLSRELLILGSIFILLLAAVLQIAVGFGAALLAIPVLVYLGWNLQECQILLTTSMLAQNAIGLKESRGDLHFREAFEYGFVRAIFIPAGLILLLMLAASPEEVLKAVIGLLILLGVFAQIYSRRLRSRITIPVDGQTDMIPSKSRWLEKCKWPSAIASGLMQGSVGMSGPPIVLWAYGQPWSVDRVRTFLFVVFLLGYPVQTVVWFSWFGDSLLGPLILGACISPLIAVASLAGVWLKRLCSESFLRNVTACLLALLALSNLWPILSKYFWNV